MKKMILLVGPGGSGKTYLRDVFNFTSTVCSHTTRPKRVNEKHGRDYYFETIVDKETFIQRKLAKNEVVAYTYYRDELYYCLFKDLYEKDQTTLKAMFIVDPAGVYNIYNSFPNTNKKGQRFNDMFEVVVLKVSDFKRAQNVWKRAVSLYKETHNTTKIPFTQYLKIIESIFRQLKNDTRNFGDMKTFIRDFNAKVVKL